MSFTEQFQADADRLVRRYPVARSALLPLLHLVQSEHGYVSDEGIAFCADRLALTKAEVGAVATFYTMFKREPVGDWLLSVCTQPTCAVAGAARIFDRYKAALGDRLTDPDTKTSIEEAECLGICDAAPVVQVNYEMYGDLDDTEADALLAGCRKGQPPVSPWSGEPAPTFAAVERELSGADDAFGDALMLAARHSVEGYEAKPAYKTGMTDLPVDHPGGDPAGHGGAIFAAGFAGGVPAAATAQETTFTEEPAEDESSLIVEDQHHPDAEHEPYTSGETVDQSTGDMSTAIRDDREHVPSVEGDHPEEVGYPGGDADASSRAAADVPDEDAAEPSADASSQGDAQAPTGDDQPTGTEED